MLQIKTIKSRLDNAGSFDNEVNEALADGWTLKRRRVLQPLAQSGTYTYIMLYAEFEKEIITEDEKTCENCKHFPIPEQLEPCVSCPNGEKWEADV